jgi:hypothetical protein
MPNSQTDLSKTSEENSTSMSQELVQCSSCGVRLPIGESFLIGGKHFCSEHRSNSKVKLKGKKWYQNWWVGLILIIIIYRLASTSEPTHTQQAPVVQPAPASVPVVVVPLPPDEKQFISIVSTAQQDVSGADNNMKKGGIKSIRDQSICKLLTSLNVKDWIATVDTIDSNSDGKGVLIVSLAKGITFKTWNNAISDSFDHTLIEPNSALFNSASSLRVGQQVKFSGKLFRDNDNCIEEGSLSLDGKLNSPEYIFKFSAISALN